MISFNKKSAVLTSALSLALIGCNAKLESNITPEIQPNLNIVETATADGRFDTLVAAVGAAGLADALQSEGPFTVFAPTDTAFEEVDVDALLADTDLLKSILEYHVNATRISSSDAKAAAGTTIDTLNGTKLAVSMNDNGLYINTSKVIVADVDTTNGVIHALDKVLSVPAAAPEAASKACEEDGALPSITERAVANPDLQTLVSAVTNASLDGVLDADAAQGAYTVFAPTDDAFAAFIEGSDDFASAAELLAATSTLENVLKSHVYNGEAAVDALTAYTLNPTSGLDTLGTGKISISIDDDGLKINDATVDINNVYACNGIVHVIDAVL